MPEAFNGPLRVAVLAPISWRVPPVHYGPWEQFASYLTEGLVQRGVEVTLFASSNSITGARLVGSSPEGYSECPSLDPKVWEAMHISSCFERADEFDLIHNSFDFLPLTYSQLVQTPMVTTIHGFSSEKILPVYQKYDANCHHVAISEADRHPSLRYAATIHHGIDMGDFAIGTGSRDRLLFFGRIHPDKGTAQAIAIARLAGLPLVIAGIVQDEDYFKSEIEPYLDGERVSFVGPISSGEKSKLLGSARALLHYVSFDEPFGYSVVEAMACGTPVIATRRGSMPELIQEGINGRLVGSVAQAAEAVVEVRGYAPEVVRRTVSERFSVERMVDEYLALYRRILAKKVVRSTD